MPLLAGTFYFPRAAFGRPTISKGTEKAHVRDASAAEFLPSERSGRGSLGPMMPGVDDETIGLLMSLVDSTYALSCVLTLAVASAPPGELSPDEMNALTDLSYKILNNIVELRKTLAQVI
jgi:hypothetical protein